MSVFNFYFYVVFSSLYCISVSAQYSQINKRLILNRRTASKRPISLTVYCASTIGAQNRLVLTGVERRTRKKMREIVYVNYRRGKFCPQRLWSQGASLRQYIGTGISIFHSTAHSFISLSPFPPICRSLPLSLLNGMVLRQNVT
jgi:hypothetical protein